MTGRAGPPLGCVRDVARVGSCAASATTATVPRVHGRPGAYRRDALPAAADFHGVAGFARLAASRSRPRADRRRAPGRGPAPPGASTTSGLVVAALGAAGVGVLVVKGPALVATCYAGPLFRGPTSTSTSLVRPTDAREAVEALEAAGCTLLDANWPLLSSAGVGEGRSPPGTDRGSARPALVLRKGGRPGPARRHADAPVRRRRETFATGRWGPADFAVHVALHAAASGGHRLVWLTDLRGALAAGGAALTSEALARTAREWGARPGLALMVSRMRRTLVPSRPPARPSRDAVDGQRSRGWSTGDGRRLSVSPGRPAGSSHARADVTACEASYRSDRRPWRGGGRAAVSRWALRCSTTPPTRARGCTRRGARRAGKPSSTPSSRRAKGRRLAVPNRPEGGSGQQLGEGGCGLLRPVVPESDDVEGLHQSGQTGPRRFGGPGPTGPMFRQLARSTAHPWPGLRDVTTAPGISEDVRSSTTTTAAGTGLATAR